MNKYSQKSILRIIIQFAYISEALSPVICTKLKNIQKIVINMQEDIDKAM